MEEEVPRVKFEKVFSHATIPKEVRTDVYVVYSLNWDSIEPGEREAISTGIFADFANGYCGRVGPLRELALKHSIDAFAAVRNKILTIFLYNGGSKPFIVKVGDPIAKLYCEEF
jgi:dUTPase